MSHLPAIPVHMVASGSAQQQVLEVRTHSRINTLLAMMADERIRLKHNRRQLKLLSIDLNAAFDELRDVVDAGDLALCAHEPRHEGAEHA